MLKRKKKKKEKVEEIKEEQELDLKEENQEQSDENTIEIEETMEEKKVDEVESKVEDSSSETMELMVEEKEESKVSGLETSIAISKDLLDEKGIDVVKVEQENKVVDDGKIEIKTTISTKNYDEAVVKLINEVKIFSDEDADLGIKPKKRVWPIILIILILLGIAGGVYYYLYIHEDEPAKQDDKKTQEETKKDILYRYEETEEGIVFYGDNEIIGTYECEKCTAYSLGTYKYFSTDPTVLAIQDGKEIFLYDYTLNSVVGEKYTNMQNLKQDEQTVAFIVTNDKGLSGIIDIRGSVIVPLEYEALGYSTSAGEVSDYSYKKDIITAKKNGYWGAINFKGEQVIPFEYEDIYYNGYNAFSGCIEGLWYL